MVGEDITSGNGTSSAKIADYGQQDKPFKLKQIRHDTGQGSGRKRHHGGR